MAITFEPTIITGETPAQRKRRKEGEAKAREHSRRVWAARIAKATGRPELKDYKLAKAYYDEQKRRRQQRMKGAAI